MVSFREFCNVTRCTHQVRVCLGRGDITHLRFATAIGDTALRSHFLVHLDRTQGHGWASVCRVHPATTWKVKNFKDFLYYFFVIYYMVTLIGGGSHEVSFLIRPIHLVYISHLHFMVSEQQEAKWEKEIRGVRESLVSDFERDCKIKRSKKIWFCKWFIKLKVGF